MAYKFEGRVSWGTLSESDLIYAFLDALEEIDSEEHLSIVNAYLKLGTLDDDCVLIEEAEEDWWLLLDELYTALDSHAPEGLYFGASPGDGTDIGWWAFESEDDDGDSA